MDFSSEDIDQLSKKELICLYRKHWKASHREFCRQYQISIGNFFKFLNPKYNGQLKYNALLRWLLNLYNDKEKNIYIKSKPLSDFTVPLADTTQAIIFIDGDQAISQIKSVYWILPKIFHIEEGILYPIKFIIVSNPNQKDLAICLDPKVKHFPNLFQFFHTNSSLENAADMAIFKLAMRCSEVLPKTVSLWLVSNDLFFLQIRQELYNIGHKCMLVNPRAEKLGLAILQYFPEIHFSSQARDFKENVRKSSLWYQLFSDQHIDYLKWLIGVYNLKSHLKVSMILGELYRTNINYEQNIKVLVLRPESLLPVDHLPELISVHDGLTKFHGKHKLSVDSFIRYFPLTSDIQRHFFYIESWQQLLELPMVQAFLRIKINPSNPNRIYRFSSRSRVMPAKNTQRSYLRRPIERFCRETKINDRYLRIFFRSSWPYNIETFCQQYDIKINNFRSWLCENRDEDPVSAAAVLRYRFHCQKK